MITEAEVMAALDQPRLLSAIKNRVTGNENALHDFLVRLRDEGKITFSIRTGKWAKVEKPEPES